MPSIRPISDLRNSANEISEYCRRTREPVFITRNGYGDMVVLSIEEYEQLYELNEIRKKLAEAEKEIAEGAKGVDFLTFADELQKRVHGS